MKVLVTGGAGYVGSAVVAELIASGARPVVLDNLSDGHRGAVPDAVPLVVGDIDDRPVVEEALLHHGIEAVVHRAASCLVGESMERPDIYYRNNLTASVALLDAMRSVEVTRIVFSSSAATYGEPEGSPIREDDRTEPCNPYGETKLAFERVLRWYGEAFGFRHVALRYFNAAGAMEGIGEDHDPETHLIPLILRVPLGKAEKARIFGDDYPTVDGSCVRDFVHVSDLGRAHVLALERTESASGVYNLGGGHGHTVKEVIAACREATGHPIPAVVAPRRPGDPARLVASAGRAREELGWLPERSSLREIVRSAWSWHERHPDGYGDE